MRVRFGECVLDSDTRQLTVRGKAVHFSLKALQFLELLLESRPKAISKSEIHERLWPGTFVSDGTLASLLVEVRSAIGDSARQLRFARTVHHLQAWALRLKQRRGHNCAAVALANKIARIAWAVSVHQADHRSTAA
jgi:hypothetical protein